MANLLSDDDYLALISMDYHQKHTWLEIGNIINPYLDYTMYYHKKLKDMLLKLQESFNDIDALNMIYDFYCQGYGFKKIGFIVWFVCCR